MISILNYRYKMLLLTGHVGVYWIEFIFEIPNVFIKYGLNNRIKALSILKRHMYAIQVH